MFELWMNYVDKYANKDYSDANLRGQMLKDFEKLSKKYWRKMFKVFPRYILVKELSQIWFSQQNKLSVEESFKQAISYIEYYSDRMTLNRWFHIRYLLNSDIL